MSVACRCSAGWLLDHLSFINEAGYQLHRDPNVVSAAPGNSSYAAPNSAPASPGTDRRPREETPLQKYVFRAELFRVIKPHVVEAVGCGNQPGRAEWDAKEGSVGGEKEVDGGGRRSLPAAPKKRKRCTVLNQGELDAIEYHSKIRGLILEGTTELVQKGLAGGFLHPLSGKENGSGKTSAEGLGGCRLAELCDMAKRLPVEDENKCQPVGASGEEMCIPEQDLFSRVTENRSDLTKTLTLMGQKYLVPPKSSFLLSDISCLQPLLNHGKKYDVIVIDPPWQNKSVKRSNRYGYLSSWQIKQIPLPKLAAPNCLVITWVTNRQKHLSFVKDELYPCWSVETLAEWHWVKITRSGEFVFPLDSPHKKPYEGLVLGRVQGRTASPLKSERKPEVEASPIPDHKIIVSVPCILHSHKPPLSEVLADYIKPDVECLELFARNLQTGWTSWGNEVLKFQHIDYFVASEIGH
ncbi:N(6)-adenine-specific methyltransferase METTL4 [Ornithorhynchus anatinus]|uniref:Methyltransferase 4, N6-adenosine n=1 Tax=Ornithorhynchus anatinus TaxID=9258 RepID=A0A6I8NLJ9_ORNAN|nr:N(6)-adenine-specific methyltransferase METTL4 [Ornithorhynchus anatinus]XP_028922591.2 N(6)-adenine-specific methyltransferase METTL4 [Ornithorhynchus anatinus]XP_028922592.1 N(6)-adenine-specific methyltransferase METTL4 [Ornithorhynchus anatinus]